MSLDPKDDQKVDTGDLLELAVSLANQASRTVNEMRADAVAAPTTKSSATDPVTAADQAAEQIVVEGITQARPNDGIIGEEGAAKAGTSAVEWYIDPIDGTTNYLYDIPAYSVSIAASVNGVMNIGVVLNPATGELFTATRGGGAFRNGHPISVSTKNALETSLVATGFGYEAARRKLQAEILLQVLPQVRDIRRFGSAALDLCWLAMGRVDAYYEIGLNIWDYAAGWLIVTEAGGRCGGLDGKDPSPDFFAAAPEPLFDAFMASLNAAATDAATKSDSNRIA